MFDKLKNTFNVLKTSMRDPDKVMSEMDDDQYKACVDHINALRILGGANIPDSEIDKNIASLIDVPLIGVKLITKLLCQHQGFYANNQFNPDPHINDPIKVGNVICLLNNPEASCVEEVQNVYGVVSELTDTECTLDVFLIRKGSEMGEPSDAGKKLTVDREFAEAMPNVTYWIDNIFPQYPEEAPLPIPNYRIQGQKVRISPLDPRATIIG